MQYWWQEVNKAETQYCPIDINYDLDANLENCEDQTYSNNNNHIDNFTDTHTLPTCLLQSQQTEESLLTHYYVLWEYRIQMD